MRNCKGRGVRASALVVRDGFFPCIRQAAGHESGLVPKAGGQLGNIPLFRNLLDRVAPHPAPIPSAEDSDPAWRLISKKPGHPDDEGSFSRPSRHYVPYADDESRKPPALQGGPGLVAPKPFEVNPRREPKKREQAAHGRTGGLLIRSAPCLRHPFRGALQMRAGRLHLGADKNHVLKPPSMTPVYRILFNREHPCSRDAPLAPARQGRRSGGRFSAHKTARMLWVHNIAVPVQ